MYVQRKWDRDINASPGTRGLEKVGVKFEGRREKEGRAAAVDVFRWMTTYFAASARLFERIYLDGRFHRASTVRDYL